MKIIVPMAGMGKRMRPHTLTVPKPLIRIAGKPIVQRLVEDIAAMSHEKIEEIAYIISDFGKEVEDNLIAIAENLGAKGRIYYQNEPLGTAHAIFCAEESLHGKVIVSFADTLFRANFTIDEAKESIIYVHKVDNPSAFGVVKVNENNVITDFIEKPETFISDLAIIGIYYFNDGENLKKELKYLLDNDIKKGTEYQLTDALENMKEKGMHIYSGAVQEWLDCGNKDATVYTNQRILEFNKEKNLISDTAVIENSVVRQPCFLGENVKVENSVIGPYVSIDEGTIIENAVISNSIIQANSKVSCVNISNSMIGNHVEYSGNNHDVSIGDYTVLS